MDEPVRKAADDFLQAAKLSGVHLTPDDLFVDVLPAPHVPKQLPTGQQAVYLFALASEPYTVLKIGKAGPRSAARFTSQHYIPGSAQSNLAKSVLTHGESIGIHEPTLDEASVGNWLRANTTRVDWYLPAALGPLALNLLEAFLQTRFRPVFEGAMSSRRQPVGSLGPLAAGDHDQGLTQSNMYAVREPQGYAPPRHREASSRGGHRELFVRELRQVLDSAAARGARYVDFSAGELHRKVGGYPGPRHVMPTCCAVMRAEMDRRDEILQQPPKGNGASLLIRYHLPRSDASE